MKVVKNQLNKLFISIFTFLLFAVTPAYAEDGEVIHIGTLETLLWSVVKTIQFYTLPLMAIAIVFLGIKLVSSGDDHQMKSDIKSAMLKIIVGGFIVFSATTIAQLLKTTLS